MRTSLLRAARVAVATMAAAAMVLLSVPFTANAATGDSYINVKVGGARVNPGGVTDVTGLQGVLLQLYTDGNDREGDPVAGAGGQCTTDANGLCTFTVPQTQEGGTNHEHRFWVKEVSASNGNNAVLNLITGTTSGFDSTPYIWRTPELSSDTVNLPAGADMPDEYNPPGQGGDIPKSRWATTGIFPAALKNPRYVAVCAVPVRIGILFDLSTSMQGTGIAGARTAGKAMVDALAQANSGALLGLYNFGTTAPKSGEANYAPIAVTAGNAGTFKSQIDGYDADGSNYTNWDRGLWQLRNENLDIVIVLTDGNPTVYGDPATPGSGNTFFNHTEQAIFSANTLKSVNGGTQILTFGVGDGVSGTPDNLAARLRPDQMGRRHRHHRCRLRADRQLGSGQDPAGRGREGPHLPGADQGEQAGAAAQRHTRRRRQLGVRSHQAAGQPGHASRRRPRPTARPMATATSRGRLRSTAQGSRPRSRSPRPRRPAGRSRASCARTTARPSTTSFRARASPCRLSASGRTSSAPSSTSSCRPA